MADSLPLRPLTSKAALLVKKRNKIRTLFRQPETSHKSFVPENDSKELWTRKEIRVLFPEYNTNQVNDVYMSYRVVITVLTWIAWPFSSDVFADNFLGGNENRTDEDLPLSQLEVEFLGAYEFQFFETQMAFKPCVVTSGKNMSTVVYPANRPWPFLELESISQGSGGEISRVLVAPRYFSNVENLSNEGPQVLAYKKFLNAADLEITNQQFLRRSISDHSHVQLHLAAILHGNDFYIFLPWTPLGDLEVLLHGGHDPAAAQTTLGTTKYDFQVEFGKASETHFVDQLTKLASALKYLHHDLVLSDTLIQHVHFYCAHSDFRPRNILVYPDETSPVGKWVIADFGISSFGVTETGSADGMPQRFDYPTVGNLAQRGHNSLQKRVGTHIAPELNPRSMRIADPRKCDIWSFGGVMTDVLAFVLGGMRTHSGFDVRQAVRSLRSFRANKTGEDDDYFYQNPPGNETNTYDGTLSDASLRDEVSEWLADQEEIHENTRNGEWVVELVLLIRDILTIDPKRRPDATDINKRLEDTVRVMPRPSMDSRLSEYINAQQSTPQPPVLGDGPSSLTSVSSQPTWTTRELESPPWTPTAPGLDAVSPARFTAPQWGHSRSTYTSPSPTNSGNRGKSVDTTSGQSSQHSQDTRTSADTLSTRSQQSRGDPIVTRPTLHKLADGGEVQKCAVSPAADRVAYLVRKFGARANLSKWAVQVFDTTIHQSNGVLLPPLPADFAWGNDSTSLSIASNLITISGLNRDKVNVAFWTTLDDHQWHCAELSDPYGGYSCHILPSVHGKLALFTKSRSIIQLRDPQVSGLRKVDRPNVKLKTVCFTADGKTLISWWWWPTWRNGQVRHEICFWDVENSTRSLDQHSFMVDPRRTEGQASILPAASHAACMYRTDESAPYHYLKAAWEPALDVRDVEIPRNPVYDSLRTACEDFWRVSIVQKSRGFRKHFELREAHHDGSGVFSGRNELLPVNLAHDRFVLAARDIGDEQRIVLASDQGELIVVSIPWQSAAGDAAGVVRTDYA